MAIQRDSGNGPRALRVLGRFLPQEYYVYIDDYDGAGRVPSFCALRQVYRTSPESSLAALSGNVSYAYWMLENSDGEPGKQDFRLPARASIMTVPVISTHFQFL